MSNLTPEQQKQEEKDKREFSDRKKKFIELLGPDCDFLDALMVNTHISYWDVKRLLDNGCPRELIPEILI